MNTRILVHRKSCFENAPLAPIDMKQKNRKAISLILPMLVGMILNANIVSGQEHSRTLPLDTLALVGNDAITSKDFLERFELMPWPRKEIQSRRELTKIEFLRSLVGEKLLAFEASNQGVGQDSTTLLQQKILEKLFARDELYKREVRAPIRISPQEINAGLRKYPFELSALVMGLPKESYGKKAYQRLSTSRRVDSVFTHLRDSLFIVIDTVKVTFGVFDTLFENVCYELKKGQFSKPFSAEPYGWIMVRLIDRYPNPVALNKNLTDQVSAVENTLRQRKEFEQGKKIFGSVLGPQRAEADEALFLLMADSVYAILHQDSAGHAHQGRFLFGSADLRHLAVSLSSSIQKSFIRISTGDLSVSEVIEGLSYNRIVFPSLRRDHIEDILNNNIKTVVQSELLARNAVRQNLQQSDNVRHDMKVWTDARLARTLMARIIDSVNVTEQEIIDFYKKNPALFGVDVMVSIQEILTDSLELALNLRRRINAGESMDELAKTYSVRKEWAAKGGRSGFFSAAARGELGFYSSSSEVNSVIGPLRLPEGYSIFKVLAKEEQKDTSAASNFESAKAQIAQRLSVEKKQRTLDRFIGSLAKKYGATLFENRLQAVQTTYQNMFTFRSIGFGGQIVATPSVSPQTEWVREWKSSEVNP